ncbi:MAG: cation-translocating P-type ATPase [Bacteroidota bacterium]
MEAKHIDLHVAGMTCNNCALSIEKYLKKEGLEGVRVDFANEEVSFDLVNPEALPKILSGIRKLGFEAATEKSEETGSGWSYLERIFAICAFFTLPLLLHMFISWHVLHNPWVQLGLTLPVYMIGILHFGRSAWASLKAGLANMDVLVFMGATAAFGYSLFGLLTGKGPDFLFFETAASIITLVLLGNLIEHRAVLRTNSSLQALLELEPPFARKLRPDGNTWEEVALSQVKLEDTLKLLTGDRIPVDGVILEGTGDLDESMMTGESLPVPKSVGENIQSGTLVLAGNFVMKATKTEKDSSLAKVIQLVKQAQGNKPKIQKLADTISGYFVPTVLGISLLTFLLSYGVFGLSLSSSLIHSIAVLVISCPCAMGLATPTAVVVGIGKASEKGILIKGGDILEAFHKVERVVFDKTGTLTDGQFQVDRFDSLKEDPNLLKAYIKGLTIFSQHPISNSLTQAFDVHKPYSFEEVVECKGKGMEGKDKNGNIYRLGASRWVEAHDYVSDGFNLALSRNGEILAKIALSDHVLPGAKEVIDFLHHKGIQPILLSGDTQEACHRVASALGIQEVYSQQSPEEKLGKIAEFVRRGPTVMVGDGINDGPALSQADIGISLAHSTEVAMEAADVILMNRKLTSLPELWKISEQTMGTIRQNLFWAFFYNVIAIPIAALGFLSPIISTLAMAVSDVIVIGNSLRLKWKG